MKSREQMASKKQSRLMRVVVFATLNEASRDKQEDFGNVKNDEIGGKERMLKERMKYWKLQTASMLERKTVC